MLAQHNKECPASPILDAPLPDPLDYKGSAASGFRPAFRYTFLLALAWSALPLLIVVPPLFGANAVAELLRLLPLTAVADFIWVVIYVSCGQVQVTADGFSIPACWSPAQHIAWAEIVSVTPINLVGWRYLRVCSKSGARRLWLPLFLADESGFVTALARCTDRHNPLRRYFDPACVLLPAQPRTVNPTAAPTPTGANYAFKQQ